MKWKGPIKKIDSSKLDGLQWQELVGKDYLSRYGTILLTRKGKVIAVCSLVILHRTGIFMCAAEEIEYGLEVQKNTTSPSIAEYLRD